MVRRLASLALSLTLALLSGGCASAPDPRPTSTVPQKPVVAPLEIEEPIDSSGITSITEEQERQVADR